MTAPGQRFRPLLDARDVAERWGMGVRTVFRLVKDGKLKRWPKRIRNKVMFRVHDVLEYEKGCI